MINSQPPSIVGETMMSETQSSNEHLQRSRLSKFGSNSSSSTNDSCHSLMTDHPYHINHYGFFAAPWIRDKSGCFRLVCGYLDLSEIVRLSMTCTTVHRDLNSNGFHYPQLKLYRTSEFTIPSALQEMLWNHHPPPSETRTTQQSQNVKTCLNPTNRPTSNEETRMTYTKLNTATTQQSCHLERLGSNNSRIVELGPSFSYEYSKSNDENDSSRPEPTIVSSTPYSTFTRDFLPISCLRAMQLSVPGTRCTPIDAIDWFKCSRAIQHRWLGLLTGLEELYVDVDVSGEKGIEPTSLARLLSNNWNSLRHLKVVWKPHSPVTRVEDISNSVSRWWSVPVSNSLLKHRITVNMAADALLEFHNKTRGVSSISEQSYHGIYSNVNDNISYSDIHCETSYSRPVATSPPSGHSISKASSAVQDSSVQTKKLRKCRVSIQVEGSRRLSRNPCQKEKEDSLHQYSEHNGSDSPNFVSCFPVSEISKQPSTHFQTTVHDKFEGSVQVTPVVSSVFAQRQSPLLVSWYRDYGPSEYSRTRKKRGCYLPKVKHKNILPYQSSWTRRHLQSGVLRGRTAPPNKASYRKKCIIKRDTNEWEIEGDQDNADLYQSNGLRWRKRLQFCESTTIAPRSESFMSFADAYSYSALSKLYPTPKDDIESTNDINKVTIINKKQTKSLPVVIFPNLETVSLQLSHQYAAEFFSCCRFPACTKFLVEEIQPIYDPPDGVIFGLPARTKRFATYATIKKTQTTTEASNAVTPNLCGSSSRVESIPQNDLSSVVFSPSTDFDNTVPLSQPHVSIAAGLTTTNKDINEPLLFFDDHFSDNTKGVSQESSIARPDSLDKYQKETLDSRTNIKYNATQLQCCIISDAVPGDPDTKLDTFDQVNKDRSIDLVSSFNPTVENSQRDSNCPSECHGGRIENTVQLNPGEIQISQENSLLLTNQPLHSTTVQELPEKSDASQLSQPQESRSRYHSSAMPAPVRLRYRGSSSHPIVFFNGDHLIHWLDVFESMSLLTEAHILLGGPQIFNQKALHPMATNLRRLYRIILRNNLLTLCELSCHMPDWMSQEILRAYQKCKKCTSFDSQCTIPNPSLYGTPPSDAFRHLTHVDCDTSTITTSDFALNVLLEMPQIKWSCKCVRITSSVVLETKDSDGPMSENSVSESILNTYRPKSPDAVAILERWLLRVLSPQIQRILVGYVSEGLTRTFTPVQDNQRLHALKMHRQEILEVLEPRVKEHERQESAQRCSCRVSPCACATPLSYHYTAESTESQLLLGPLLINRATTDLALSTLIHELHHNSKAQCAPSPIITGESSMIKSSKSSTTFISREWPDHHLVEHLRCIPSLSIGVVTAMISSVASFSNCIQLEIESLEGVSSDVKTKNFARMKIMLNSFRFGNSIKGRAMFAKPRLRVFTSSETPPELFSLLPKFSLGVSSLPLLSNILQHSGAVRQLRGLIGNVSRIVAALQTIKSSFFRWQRPDIKVVEVWISNIMVRCLCTISKLVVSLGSFRKLTEFRVFPRKVPPFLSVDDVFCSSSPEGHLLTELLHPFHFRRNRLSEVEARGLCSLSMFIFTRPPGLTDRLLKWNKRLCK